MAPASTGDRGRSGNVADLLRTAAGSFPARTALLTGTGSRTWAELDRAADAGAAALAGSGLEPGDRVIVSLETGPDIVAALFAVARAGSIAVPIGPNRTDLDAIVAKVEPRGAVAAQSEVPVGIRLGPDEVRSWWETRAPAFEPVGQGEDIAVLARAASSNRPVMVSHRALLAAVSAIAGAPRLKLTADDRAVLVLPSYHLAGWVTAFLPLALVGAAAVVPDPPTAESSWIDSVLAAIRTHRVTVVPGAPSLYRRLRTATGVERALASVRLMTSGAAPLDPEVSSAIRALTGQPVWEGYGISESASVVSSSLMTTASRPGSVGRTLPGLSVRIVGDDGADLYAEEDPDTGTDDELAPDTTAGGEVGRIQISGPTLFSGYWPDGADGPDDDGWFGTGDLGYFDDRDELHLVDRATETIRIAGFTVYPREIEDVLTGHPYVRDAAVIGAPGPAGDGVVAVLVALWGTRPTAADLDEFVAARLPVFKRPLRYTLVDRLPRNEIGRIDRDEVRALYRNADPLPEPGEAAADSAEQAAEVLAQAPQVDPPEQPREPAPVVVPEPAGPLDELGRRLPGVTGRRGDEDTDDDLF